jgi:hypothetical protein
VRGKASHLQPGVRIKLRAIHDGQGWLTTSAWIEEYLTAITLDRGGCAPRAAIRARGQRALARLAARGF